MTPAQLRASLSTLGLSQARAAALLGVTTDAVSKWANGKRAIPGPVARLVWLMDYYHPRDDIWDALQRFRTGTK